ncbi:RNA-binding protein [Halodurantibacterium flavum]|uniref:RNA-binding protein n=1 Tax=Halodurantibacterium flavum TaxID=1382802 RepID=A0ABW4S9V1_9RHOB
MTRGGRDKDRDEPERRCIATGESQPKAGLIRFVVGPEGQVIPDLLERLPGRGIWVSADRAAVEKAVKKGLFARAARQPVQTGDLVSALEAGLGRRVVDLLSLARKGGAAVAGFEKVKDWLVKDQAEVLIQACDGSERGKTKLRPPEPVNAGDTTFIGCLTAAELGLAFGREHVIHAALAAGGLTARVVDEARKLSGIRGQIGGRAAGKDTKDA